jgi:sodium/proline symporter
MTFAIAFAVYTLLIVGVGMYSARHAKKSDEDYFLAGRSLGPWVAALSSSASSESGWVTVGLVGMGFTSGYASYWIIPGCLLGFIFNWFVMAAPMRDHSVKLNAVTLPDFFAFNFRERIPLLRILTVLVILVAMWMYVAAQFAAAGKAFSTAFSSPETQFPYWVGVLLGTVIVLLYTVVGGFRATCWTDFLQGLVMCGVLLVFPIFLLIKADGYGAVGAQLAAADPNLVRFWPTQTGFALIGFILGSGALGINFGFPGQPHVLVRYMALRNPKEALAGGIISVVWGAIVFWGAATVGIVVRAMTESGVGWTAVYQQELAEGLSAAGETGLVLSSINMIGGVLSGMVLAAVLSAICSTADSQLVVAASAGASDVYSRLVKKSKAAGHLLVNRTVVFVLGIAACLLVISEEVRVYTFVLDYAWAVLGAAIGPQVILILLWKRASYAGCLAGMLTGFLLPIVWKHTYMAYVAAHPETGLPEVYNLTLAFIAALVINVVVSLLLPSRKAE